MSRHIRLTPADSDFYHQTRAYEKDLVIEALAISGGNQSEAARYLGMSRTSFLSIMKRETIFASAPAAYVPQGFAVQRAGRKMLIVTCWTRADMLHAIQSRRTLAIYRLHVDALTHAAALEGKATSRLVSCDLPLAPSSGDAPSPPAVLREQEGGYYQAAPGPGPTMLDSRYAPT